MTEEEEEFRTNSSRRKRFSICWNWFIACLKFAVRVHDRYRRTDDDIQRRWVHVR